MSDESTTDRTAVLAATNRVLARQVLELLGTKEQFELYADDMVMEFPFATSLTSRLVSKAEMVDYVQHLLLGTRGLVLRDIAVSSVAGDPTTVFVEYELATGTPSGDTLRQSYVSKMTFRDGKVVQMRQLWDPKRIVDAGIGTLDKATDASQ